MRRLREVVGTFTGSGEPFTGNEATFTGNRINQVATFTGRARRLQGSFEGSYLCQR
ncbi:hypothetical protein [Legionella drancourtii]|uniref:hypothetical protein n=1 Tax=Legionella drancourtii TaxID=168933 RepID=UPI00130541C5|nr:hypothetical protein [Legionella drancourtii]